MGKNDNITEFNSEALSEQELNAYLSMVEEDTPDLWDRIEEGFAEEAGDVKNNENDKVINITSRKMKRKYIAIIAACALAVVVAIPVLGGAMGGRKKSNDCVSKVTDNIAYEDTEAYPMEDSITEASGDAAVNGAGEQNNYMFDAASGEATEGSSVLTQDAEESMEENTGHSAEKYIMVDDSVYEYAGEYVNRLPDGYTVIGTVQTVDIEYPDENFKGTGLEVGQNIYGSSSDAHILYIEVHENGYEKFIKK